MLSSFLLQTKILILMGELEVSICKEEEWQEARKCLVRAFRDYALYQYLLRDNDKRETFLRGYLDAIYDVTVRRGRAVLICVKLKDETLKSSDTHESKKVIIAAVLLVPPTGNGGWECAKDQEFWAAYEKYKLKEIDEDGFNRIKQYENWEYRNITQRICNSGIPMWNGILCGVDPHYAAKGWGTMSYNSCLRLVENLHNEKAAPATNPLPFANLLHRLRRLFGTDTTDDTQISGLLIKFLHSLSMLSRRAPILPDLTPKQKAKATPFTIPDIPRSYSPPPIIFAVSHSVESVGFHKKNGFCTIVERLYENAGSEDQSGIVVQAMAMQICSELQTGQPKIIPCMTSSLKDHSLVNETVVAMPNRFEENVMDNYCVSTV